MRVDGLRFEYEKRQRRIQLLQMKISQLSMDLENLYQEWEERRSAAPKAWDYEGAYPGGLDSIPHEIGDLEREIGQLESEMDDIETVLGGE